MLGLKYMLARFAGWLCWQGLLAGFARWLALMAGFAGWLGWEQGLREGLAIHITLHNLGDCALLTKLDSSWA
jgi:hypothetical protein